MIYIYPTNTCYGLGCSVFNKKEISKIYSIKKRDKKKALIVLVDSIKMWETIAQVSNKAKKIAKEYFPIPLTIIQKVKNSIPNNLCDKEIAVRITNNKYALRIIKELNAPLVSTSANISGEKTPYSLKEIPKEVKEKVDKIMDIGELNRDNLPSTVIKIVNDKIKIVRQGKLKII